ncbi:hypothetical protein HRE53_30915 (plasmid) [Acaryochloris sp. 'Moss Beach']|uniref:hypothetical protein n=1 Tax=Acaryochloris sp. 'Moss Beach' TaxID=2740837 RepID=UPI001F2F5452|nr:hypothetical protein [Acaryochloris sp. 'Moss Beach']UJB73126.1 hypothetical protein HRE53_30915 [Acaryochloris sp. 'Moss Beach']
MEDIKSPLLTITSKDNKLIGDVFSAFSGFLDERFREFDYDMGRLEARKQLLLFNEQDKLRELNESTKKVFEDLLEGSYIEVIETPVIKLLEGNLEELLEGIPKKELIKKFKEKTHQISRQKKI